MKKKAISLALVMVLLFALAVPTFAATSTPPYPLHQGIGPFDWKDYRQGTDFDINVDKGEDKFVPGFELGTKGTVIWHFVNPDKLGGYANITFLNENGVEVTIEKVTPYKSDMHFAVVTYQSWKLLSAAYYPATTPPDGSGTLFNLSHTTGKEQQYGALKVTVDVDKQHEEVTWQRYYERDVQDFYQRDVQDFYQRDVQDFYSRDVQDFYQRESYKRYVPLFEKKVSINKTNTLTSRLGSNKGGKFTNGMVWLEIDVNKARKDGYTFGIAQSNPDNTYIGYGYNVKIEGDKLIVSFDDKLISANITAKVYNTAPNKHDNSKHVTLRTGDTLPVNLPAKYGDKVYLYVHFENGVSWYTTGQYEFIGWRYKDTIISDYKKIRTEIGEYTKYKTEIGEYTFDKTEYGNYKLIDTFYGDYKLVGTNEVARKTVKDAYDAEFNLVVKNQEGNPVYTGKIKNKGEVVIPQLFPGKYTIVLSGDDIDEQIKYADVVVSGTAQVNLKDIPAIIGEQVDIYLEDIKTDNKLEDVKKDKRLEDVKTDNKLEDVWEDNKLPNVYLPDKTLPDEKLGNETDPYGEYAIRLN